MARCGCSGGCGCLVRSGSSNVHVAGNGSAQTPFTVSVDEGGGGVTFIEALDSDTVDVEVTGAGTEGNPYVITASVKGTVMTEFDVTVHHHTPADGDVADRFYTTRDCELVRVLSSLEVDGSTNTVVDVDVDGVSAATVTILAASHVQMDTLGSPAAVAAATNRVNVVSTTVGTDAAGLVTVLTFRPT